MSLKLVRYTNDHAAAWDNFIVDSLNGNILHTRGFYNSNPANAGDEYSLLFYKKNNIAAVVPAIMKSEDGIFVFHSHPRSTYGGLLINKEIGVAEALEIIDLLIAEMKKEGVSRIIIRNPFRIFYKQISDEADYAFWYYDFKIQSREAEIYIDLTADAAVIRKRYDNGTKYNIKKAYNFVSVRESADLAEFWKILERNLDEKHGKKPVHSYEDILLLKDNIGSENIVLFGAYRDETLVAGCLVFKINHALHAQYIAQDSNCQEFRPLNAVLDFIIGRAKDDGYRYFNLGTANEGGKVVNAGLFHFKESFGGRSVLRETMYLDL